MLRFNLMYFEGYGAARHILCGRIILKNNSENIGDIENQNILQVKYRH